jgi:type IV secretion system protein VirB10
MKVPVIAALFFASVCGRAAEIPSGTHLLLRMMNSVNTRTASEGDQVYLQTASPVAINNEIVIPAGTYVQGTVSYTKRSGRVKGRAQLGLHLETMTLASGRMLRISPRLSTVDSGETGQKVDNKEGQIQQGSSVGKDVGRIAILAGSGAAIGGLADESFRGAGIGAAAGSAVGLATALLTRGNEVDLRQGTTLDVVFDRSVVVE